MYTSKTGVKKVSLRLTVFCVSVVMVLFSLTTTGQAQELISIGSAVSQGLKHAPEARLTDLKFDLEDHNFVYDLKFINKNGTRTEVSIDALNGTLLEAENKGKENPRKFASFAETIPYEKAIESALQHVKGTVSELYLKINRRNINYVIEILDEKGFINTIVIDANTGKAVFAEKGYLPQGQTLGLTLEQANKKALEAMGGGLIAISALDFNEGLLSYKIQGINKEGQISEFVYGAMTGVLIRQKIDY